MTNDALLPIIIAIIAALPGLWAMLSQRKERDASAAKTLTDSAVEIVNQYKARAEERDAEYETRLDAMDAGYKARLDAMEAGLKPVQNR